MAKWGGSIWQAAENGNLEEIERLIKEDKNNVNKLVLDVDGLLVVVVPAVAVAAMPRGIVKSKIAALAVPTLVTDAGAPGAPVVVVPAATVAAVPSGMPKSRTTFAVVPELVTVALDPGTSVVVVPTAMFV